MSPFRFSSPCAASDNAMVGNSWLVTAYMSQHLPALSFCQCTIPLFSAWKLSMCKMSVSSCAPAVLKWAWNRVSHSLAKIKCTIRVHPVNNSHTAAASIKCCVINSKTISTPDLFSFPKVSILRRRRIFFLWILRRHSIVCQGNSVGYSLRLQTHMVPEFYDWLAGSARARR